MHALTARQTVLSQFVRFGLVGAAGFLVDSAVLMLMLKVAHTGLYSSRVVSFLAAATFTWAANRVFTFRTVAGTDESAVAQWMRFVTVNALGGVVNFGSYALVVSQLAVGAKWPVIGVAVGSLTGMLFNFVLSRKLVFRAHSGRVAER
jgi:putative flippase GtrA